MTPGILADLIREVGHLFMEVKEAIEERSKKRKEDRFYEAIFNPHEFTSSPVQQKSTSGLPVNDASKKLEE